MGSQNRPIERVWSVQLCTGANSLVTLTLKQEGKEATLINYTNGYIMNCAVGGEACPRKLMASRLRALADEIEGLEE